MGGVIVKFVVNRDAFGMPKAADTEDNYEVQKGRWSKEWIGLYCKAALPLSRPRT